MKTLFIGQNHIKLKEVDSTNEYASLLLKSGLPPEGTLISTISQTNGRGQRGKQWLSETGSNIIVSIILQPGFVGPEKQFELNKAIALGIVGFVSNHISTKKVLIKWPNDIYVNENKIAGILIENNLRNNRIQSSVIGIGCNINQTLFDEKIPNPTSLKNETGKDYSIANLIEELCSYVEAKYLDLRNGNSSSINESYNKFLYKRDEQIRFKKNNDSIISGILKKVNDKGMLVLENQQKEEILLSNSDGYMITTKP